MSRVTNKKSTTTKKITTAQMELEDSLDDARIYSKHARTLLSIYTNS